MKNWVAWFFFVGLVGLGVWNWRLTTQLVAREAELHALSTQTADLKNQLNREQKKNQAEYQAESSAADRVRSDLAQEEKALEALERQLNLSNNQGSRTDDLSSVQERLAQQKQSLSELNAQLRSVEVAKKNLDSQNRSQSQQDQWQRKAGDAELAEKIREAETQLKTLNAEISDMKKRRIDFDGRQRIEDLQPQVAQQKILIQQLKDQRQQTKMAWDAHSGERKSQTSLQRESLNKTEQEIRAEIGETKGAIAQLSRQAGEDSKQRTADKQTRLRLETDYRNEKAKVQALRADLEEREKRLKEIAP